MLANLILREDEYKEKMENVVEPYLAIRRKEMWLERETDKKIYCVRYLADAPRGVVMISHGFTETAEKYKEVIYYFVKAQYHVYIPEYCGHGFSYRLSEDPSLVSIDHYQRYVEDFLFVSRFAKDENLQLPLYLFGHSMGGGLGAAEAANAPDLFSKVILSSPMIFPNTGAIPGKIALLVTGFYCKSGKGNEYVLGHKPYDENEAFEDSCDTSRERFQYYYEKRKKEPLFQMSAASYFWANETGKLRHYLLHTGWKKIQAPVLVFQADDERLVNNKDQERFVRKLARKGEGMGKLIRVPGSKHEIYNSESRIVEGYWKKIFAFLKTNEK